MLNSDLATKQDVAVIQFDVRTLEWVVASVGLGILTVMLGVSLLVIEIFGTA